MHHNPADEIVADLGAETLDGSGFENEQPEAVYEDTHLLQAEVAQ
jgi:hypothetical protein